MQVFQISKDKPAMREMAYRRWKARALYGESGKNDCAAKVWWGVLVKPGSRIPLDATVVEPHSEVVVGGRVMRRPRSYG